MKIALLPLHRAIDSRWGSEITEAYRFAVELAKYKSLDITAVVGYADKLAEETLGSQINLINLNITPGFNLISYLKFQIKMIEIGRKIGKEYDVVHHFFPSSVFQSFSAYPFLHPDVSNFVFGPILFQQQELLSVDSEVYSEKLGWNNSPRLDQYMRFSSTLQGLLHRLTLTRCNHIFFDSYFTREYVLAASHGLENISSSVLPSSFLHVNALSTPNDSSDELVIGVLAYYRRTKHADVLLRALGKLKNSKVRIRLAGDGPILPELKKLTSDLDLEKRVDFLGHLNEVQIDEFKRSIDFMWSGAIFPFDGLPSIREAMAVGIPIIGVSMKQDVEWLPFGVLVRPLSSEILSEIIGNLVDNRSSLITSMRKEAFAYAKKEFDTDILMRRVLSVYGKT